VLLAVFAVFGAPWLKARLGTAGTLCGNFVLMAIDLAVIGIWPDDPAVVMGTVIVPGLHRREQHSRHHRGHEDRARRAAGGIDGGFVRFIGGGFAPFVAGKLVEHYNAHVPFILGAGTVLVAALVLGTVHKALAAADRGEVVQPELTELDRIERENELAVAAAIGNED